MSSELGVEDPSSKFSFEGVLDESWRDGRKLNLLSVNKYDEFLASRFPKLWAKYRVCGQFGIGFHCDDCGTDQYVPNSCGVRGCPTCGKYQYQRLYKRYDRALKGLPQHNLRKVELTAGKIELTKESLNAWFTAACKVLDVFWSSYFAGLEVSPGGHVHLHALTSGRYVGQRELSRMADKMLGKPIVWISRNGKVRYLIKDAAKVPEFKSADLRIRYFLATRGLRMFRSRGLLYGLGDVDGHKSGCACPLCGGSLRCVGLISPVEDRRYSRWGSAPPPLDSSRPVADWVRVMMEAAGAGCSG
jgi:hypothetical protein